MFGSDEGIVICLTGREATLPRCPAVYSASWGRQPKVYILRRSMEFLMEWHSRYISGISMHVYVASVLTESTIRGPRTVQWPVSDQSAHREHEQ